MMNGSVAFLLRIVFVFIMIQCALTVQTTCFKCSSSLSGNCGAGFDGAIIGTEGCTLPVCLKITSDTEVTRGCGSIMKDQNCVREGNEEICTCRLDLCNTASHLTITMATAIVTLAATGYCLS